MSLHYLLRLPYDASDEEVEKTYRQLLFKCHPDRSRKDTTSAYLQLRQAYKEFKELKSNDNFYTLCSKNRVNSVVCRCGCYYDLANLVFDKVECESCSCYVLVIQELK